MKGENRGWKNNEELALLLSKQKSLHDVKTIARDMLLDGSGDSCQMFNPMILEVLKTSGDT